MSLKAIINYIREDENNLKIINYLLILYVATLVTFWATSGKIFILIVLLFLLNNNLKEHIKYSLKNKVVQAFILYFILHALWIIGSDNLDIALYLLKYNKILLFPIIFVAVVRKEFIDKILYTFLIVIFLSAVYSVLIYFGIADSIFRVSSQPIAFLYKSDLGFFLLIGIAFSVLTLFSDKSLSKINIAFLVFFVVLATFVVFIIGARIYMFGYILIFLILSILIFKDKIYQIVLLVIFSLFSAGIIYLSIPKVNTQINKIFINLQDSIENKNYNSSAGARVGMIIYSLPVIYKNPIFGVGTGDHVPDVLAKIYADPSSKNSKKYAELFRSLKIGKSSFLHNTYIQHLVEFGIIGLILYFNIFYQLFKSKQSTEVYKNLLILISILWLFMGIAGADFIYNQSGKIFILFISLLICNQYLNSTRKTKI